ncbi:MAG: M48 family metallopeptidase, partial [Muribaculaceae bacterium]|nr:M48 family metallopeptidase [Muribaculaceae bacterium]
YVDFITSAPERDKLCNVVITVNSTLVEKRGLDDAALIKFVNSAIVYAAKECTRRYIVPHAASLARGLGLEPKRWSVRDTKRQYGSCSASGEISLSARLIFLPAELRDFIIYHELAHMTELNHSDAFHRLCDSYCGGREREFESRLRSFKSPIF